MLCQKRIKSSLMFLKNFLRAWKAQDHGWLDLEDIYRDEGWTVEYDSPGYNETYEARSHKNES